MIKPFHTSYYIKNNKVRSLILTVLMSFIFVCYLGGLYISSRFYENLNTIGVYKHFAVVTADAEQEGAEQEGAPWQTEFIRHALSVPGVGAAMESGYYADPERGGGKSGIKGQQKLLFTSLIGVPGGIPMPVFHASEDFTAFNGTVGLLKPDYVLEDGCLVMSDLFRRNFGIETGGNIEAGGDMAIGLGRSVKLAATFDANSYASFRVDSSHMRDSVLLLRERLDDKEAAIRGFDSAIALLKQEYPDLQFIDYQYQNDYINSISTTFRAIIIPVSIIVAMVLAITINAILIGEYASRKFEFSIYRATGFSKREVSLKIMKETAAINLLGLLLGAVAVTLLIFILNETVLFDRGLHLPYFCSEAVVGTALCEVAVFIPIVIFQVNRIRKHDVTDY